VDLTPVVGDLPHGILDVLTGRGREVVLSIAAGRANHEIAARLRM